MERLKMWLFPIALVLAWLFTTAHVLSRLGALQVTLAEQRQLRQPAQQPPEEPASSEQKLAKR